MMVDSQVEFYMMKNYRKSISAAHLLYFSDLTIFLGLFCAKKKKNRFKKGSCQRKERILSGEDGHFWTFCKGYSKARWSKKVDSHKKVDILEFQIVENVGKIAPIVPLFLFVDPTTIFQRELMFKKKVHFEKWRNEPFWWPHSLILALEGIMLKNLGFFKW